MMPTCRKRFRPRIATLCVTVVLAAFVGCNSEQPVPDQPAAEVTSPDAAPADGTSFEDVTTLVAAINDGGVACKDMRLLDAPQESIEDFGLCFITPEYEKDIYLFRTVEDRDAWAGSFSGNPGIHLLVGPNWFITSGSAEELAQIQAVIGGELRSTP